MVLESNVLLSIIIPCYNSESYISTTLDMLISQGLNNCEIIVINDGSEDKTSEIIKDYANKYTYIKIINKKNEGVSVARNIGMDNADGKYVYFLDSDDALEIGTLDFFRKVLTENSNKKMFAFGYYSKYKSNVVKNYAVNEYDCEVLDSSILKQNFLGKKLCFHICSCIYEKAFLVDNAIRFTPGLRIGEDIEFILNVLRFVPNCVYHARICFIYQIRDDSVMQGYKFFSELQYHSYEIRRNVCFLEEFQTNDIVKFTNFWLLTQLLSHLISYLKSDFKDKKITENFINELHLFKLPISKYTNKKIFTEIKIAKLLPLKLILKILK